MKLGEQGKANKIQFKNSMGFQKVGNLTKKSWESKLKSWES